MASLSDIAAIYALGAGALTCSLVMLLHLLEPEFDPSWRMLSEYSLGRYGVLMRLAFLAWGTSVIAVAAALSAWAWPWSLGLVVVAVGPLGAAFVDTDPITTPHSEMSRRSKVHAVLGLLFILGFPPASTVTGISAAGGLALGQTLAWASLVPWLALLWLLAASIRYAPADGRAGPQVRVGWPNRMLLGAYVAWAALAAALVLR